MDMAFRYASIIFLLMLTQCGRKAIVVASGGSSGLPVSGEGASVPGRIVQLEFYGPDTLGRGVCRAGFGVAVQGGDFAGAALLAEVELVLSAGSVLKAFRDPLCAEPFEIVPAGNLGMGVPIYLKGTRAETVALSLKGANVVSREKSIRVGFETRLQLDGNAGYSFGDVGVLATLNHMFMLTNTGAESAQFTAARIAVPQGGFRVVSHTCEMPIDPGETCNIIVSFTPAVAESETSKLAVSYRVASDEYLVEKGITGRGVPGTNVNYLFDATRVASYLFSNQLIALMPLSLGGYAELALRDQTDDDMGSLGFGGGVSANLVSQLPLQIDPLVTTFPRIGRQTSRLMTMETEALWNRLAWIPRAPYGKPLPDLGAGETGYAEGALDMGPTGLNNILLLHSDETNGVPRDTSGMQSPTSIISMGNQFDPNGRILGARAFNSTVGNYVSATSLRSMRNDALTVSSWVKVPPTTGTRYFISYSKSTNDNHLLMGLTSTTLVYFYSNHNVSATVKIDDGRWHHVALVWAKRLGTSGSNSTLYVDGTAVKTSSHTESTISTGGTLVLGQEQDTVGGGFSASQAFTGSIDELAVFANALSVTQIRDLYRRGAMRLQFQVRACPTTDNCDITNYPFVGPDGSANSNYSELTNTSLSRPSIPFPTALTGKVFQYTARFDSDVQGDSPQLDSVTVDPSHYSASRPTLSPAAGVQFSALNGFFDSYGPLHRGSVVYRMSKDGANWAYHDGTVWKASADLAQANTAAEINSKIASLITYLGGAPVSLRFQAIFISPTGLERVQLERVTVIGTIVP